MPTLYGTLIGDLMDYCRREDEKQMGSKALRVYNKALKSGRTELAEAIRKKYERQFPKSDRVVALSMMLMAQKQLKQKGENNEPATTNIPD